MEDERNETMEEAARRLIGVMDERRRNKAAALHAAQIEPASASNGLAEDARSGGVHVCRSELLPLCGRQEGTGPQRNRKMAGPRAEEGVKPPDRFRCKREEDTGSEWG